MDRFFSPIWIVVGSILAAGFVAALVNFPGAGEPAMKFIPVAALAGFTFGIPLSYAIVTRFHHGAGRRR